MTSPAAPWIVRLPVSGDGEDSRRKAARDLLSHPLISPDAMGKARCIDTLPLGPADDGPEGQEGAFLIEADAEAIGRVDELTKALGLRRVKSRPLASIPVLRSPSRTAPPMDMPAGNPGGEGVHVAIIGNESVREHNLWSNVHRFAVTPQGIDILSIFPPGDSAHATDMAALMAGRGLGPASGAEVWSYRLGRANGAWNMLKALRHASQRTGVKVVCIATEAEDEIPFDTLDEIRCLHALIGSVTHATRRSLVFVSAAGNAAMVSPATAPSAITVGAIVGDTVVSAKGDAAKDKPTIVARGRPAQSAGGARVEWTTSMAAPYVAGCIATWFRLKPSLTHEEVRSLLVATCSKPPGYSKDTHGFGVFEPEKVLKKLST